MKTSMSGEYLEHYWYAIDVQRGYFIPWRLVKLWYLERPDIWSMFEGATSFNQDLSNFDTSSVVFMNGMFYNAEAFNGDVSNFDTSSVTDMSSMFSGATSFNQDVSNFDTSSVTDMRFMFNNATSFNQDLCSWQDNFPYNRAFGIFLDSGCTYQDTPTQVKNGPFCASNCSDQVW